MYRIGAIIVGFLGLFCLPSCVGPRISVARIPLANPILVADWKQDDIWERAVDVLHDYRFEVARDNRLDGIIETKYKVGSGILEPWHRDSVGASNRVESTLQSIRRRVFISVTPAEGGLLVSVEAFKELEDLPPGKTPSIGVPGGATFQESPLLGRDLEVVTSQSTDLGWIPQGRDTVLEQSILRRLQASSSR